MTSRLRGLNVAPKLFAGFGVVCLLLAVVVGVGITRLQSSQADLDRISTQALRSVQTIGVVRASYLNLRQDIANAALTTDSAGTEAALATMAEDDVLYDEAWQAYLDSSPAAPRAQRDAVEDTMAEYRAAREELVARARAKDTAGFIAYRTATTLPITREYLGQLEELVQAESASAKATATASSSDVRQAVIVLLTLGALALVVSVAVAVVVARSIAGPLARTLSVVQGLADGRLDARVGCSGTDEV
ncbi:MCP four helix bundle domain-containing protein, partial [Kineococcus esterisolvens]|uniref:MCP four helix bundle domain-containing protein n=1 Tax=unclassified Kineococcus TaxID=2621656 RepID=UPI003D7DC28C